MPLRRANGFFRISTRSRGVAKRATLMYLNSRTTPPRRWHTAVLSKVFASRRAHHIIVCHYAMYSELRFDGYRPPSFLRRRAMDVGVEFHPSPRPIP